VTLRIYSPEPVHRVANDTLAVRAGSLNGLTIGFLGNLKPNADVLLHATEQLVLAAGAGDTRYHEKVSCSLGASTETLDAIAASCRAAVVGLGDCGSCTSWCIHDAVELDRRDVPSVVYVAEPFVELARFEAKGLGLPSLKLVVLPYPMAGVEPAEIVRRAEAAFPEVESALVDSTPVLAG
jgi:hypothetical protein